jgi:hypothetical protein
VLPFVSPFGGRRPNPFTGDNEANCTPSSTRKYTCRLDSEASNLTGPILLAKWVLADSD